MISRRILLTGATGFVGSEILSCLKKDGHFVRAITRRSEDSGFADEYVLTPNLFCEPTEWWEKQLEGIDLVIHAAWYVEHGEYLYSDKNDECLSGSLRLVDGFEKSSATHFVGIGTCFEYDLDHGVLSVDTPLKPTSPYAETKVKLFEDLKKRFSKSRQSYGWCRLFYLYGKNEHPDRFFSYLHRELSLGNEVNLTSGTQVRDFMNVEDAGKMVAAAAVNNISGAINICSGTGVSIRTMAEDIADQYQKRHLLKFGAREDNLVDPPKVVGVPGPGFSRD